MIYFCTNLGEANVPNLTLVVLNALIVIANSKIVELRGIVVDLFCTRGVRKVMLIWSAFRRGAIDLHMLYTKVKLNICPLH